MNIYDQPLAFNVCDQMLREVEKIPTWTMAHVLMNPGASSLLHEHHIMQEAYIITRGSGHLIVGKSIFSVQVGDVVWISTYVRHKLINTSAGSLEHLVLAAPPFDPQDVYLDEQLQDPKANPMPFIRPPTTDCFDGAKIVAYEVGNIASVAFGWVMHDLSLRKPPHYHKKTTEWIFVVEGEGFVILNGTCHPICCGDWIQVDPGQYHALRNNQDQHMVVACFCNPCFSMDDVYYE